MSEFNTQGKTSTPILPDELEQKIEEANKHLVETREGAAKFTALKEQREKDLAALDQKKAKAQDELDAIEAKKKESSNEVVSLQAKTQASKQELAEVNEQVAAARKDLDETLEKSKKVVADLDARTESLKLREDANNVYARALAEKEKKLDEYAAKVRRMVDSLKGV